MAIVINDGLEVRAPKPGDARFIVGTGLTYISKEDIPKSYRYLWLVVTDNATGINWRLEGGIEDANWVSLDQASTTFVGLTDTPTNYGSAGQVASSDGSKVVWATPEDNPPVPILWEDLVALNGQGLVKVWDKYIVTDYDNRPLELSYEDSDGELWYNDINPAGTLILMKLPGSVVGNMTPMNKIRFTQRIVKQELPSIIMSRLKRDGKINK